MADQKPAPKLEGKRTYMLTEKCYIHGVLHQAGETLTIDLAVERPGKTWVELKEAPAPKVMIPATEQRAADKSI